MDTSYRYIRGIVSLTVYLILFIPSAIINGIWTGFKDIKADWY